MRYRKKKKELGFVDSFEGSSFAWGSQFLTRIEPGLKPTIH
jgi:hypothetical protein